MSALGLYVHLPFCPQRCPYCGFAVVTGMDHLHQRYASAVVGEIRRRCRGCRPFDTIFLGGGTPTRLSPALVGLILEAAAATAGIAAGAEITIEANPSSADQGRFEQLRAMGCTRLSLGVQSFGDRSL
ncbi:MAG: radical SAM protein, partial [Gemmatimonadota bacterium]